MDAQPVALLIALPTLPGSGLPSIHISEACQQLRASNSYACTLCAGFAGDYSYLIHPHTFHTSYNSCACTSRKTVLLIHIVQVLHLRTVHRLSNSCALTCFTQALRTTTATSSSIHTLLVSSCDWSADACQTHNATQALRTTTATSSTGCLTCMKRGAAWSGCGGRRSCTWVATAPLHRNTPFLQLAPAWKSRCSTSVQRLSSLGTCTGRVVGPVAG